jgi:hypothetical protein
MGTERETSDNVAYSCAEAVPSDARTFTGWVNDHNEGWPPTLIALAARARLSLRAMEAGAAHQSEVTDAMNKRDLQAFVEAYEAFRANSVSRKDP